MQSSFVELAQWCENVEPRLQRNSGPATFLISSSPHLLISSSPHLPHISSPAPLISFWSDPMSALTEIEKTIFLTAIDKAPGAERDAYLAQACAGNARGSR